MVAFRFSPKKFGGGEDLQIVILLEKECSFSGVSFTLEVEFEFTT